MIGKFSLPLPDGGESPVKTRWVDVEYGDCVVEDGENTGYQNVTQKEQRSLDSGETWTDTGNARETTVLNTDACPLPTTRWVNISYGDCAVSGGYNTGYQNVTQKEQRSTDGGTTWTDTGETRTTTTYNASACPLPQTHAHISVDQISHDYANEVALPTAQGTFHQVSSPTKSGYNFLFVSICAGKTLTVLNAMNVDISSQFTAVGTDERNGYYDNAIYKLVNAFGTSLSATFYIKIS